MMTVRRDSNKTNWRTWWRIVPAIVSLLLLSACGTALETDRVEVLRTRLGILDLLGRRDEQESTLDALESIADGLCDVGNANHYYLARLLEEDPDFPVRLHWVDQDGRGVHVNISGGGVTRYADDPDLGQRFLEWLATDGQSIFVDGNHEYPANPSVEPEALIAERFGTDFVRDPLNPSVFGNLNADAVRLMDEVGYR